MDKKLKFANKALIAEMVTRSTATREQCAEAISILSGLFYETWTYHRELHWPSLAMFHVVGCQVNHAKVPYVSYRLHARWMDAVRDTVRGERTTPIQSRGPTEAIRRLVNRLGITETEARVPYAILKEIILEALLAKREPLCIRGVGTFRQHTMTVSHKQMFGEVVYGEPRVIPRPHFKPSQSFRSLSPSRKKVDRRRGPASLADTVLQLRRIG